MWVDGVGWSQTIVHHCSYGIFDPFFPPKMPFLFFFICTKIVSLALFQLATAALRLLTLADCDQYFAHV